MPNPRLLSACLSLAALLASACGGEASGPLADLEELGLAPDSFWNGQDGSGGFESGPLRFENSYDAEYGSWSGFAASTRTDTSTPGWENQYSAVAGAGAGGSATYAIGYTGQGPARLRRVAPGEARFQGLWVCNTTYAYLSMRDGDAFAKKLGGDDGQDMDWFRLTIQGKDAADGLTGTVEVYLADFRGPASEDVILADWTWVDLSTLGPAQSLELGLASSDVGEWGMNTPAYFALDRVELAD